MHVHEVFFRDTAHGFLTWALATIIGLLLAGSAASSIIGGGVHAAATVAGRAAQGAGQIVSQTASGVSAYDVDSLFRSDHPRPGRQPTGHDAQVDSYSASGVANGEVPAADRTYLVQLVAARTGISQADAEKRVDDVIAREKAAEEKAKQAADAARKAAAQFAIFAALSMMIGAFIASAAAAYGGNIRDEHVGHREISRTARRERSALCLGEAMVDENRVEGAARNIGGKIQDAVGAVTGDTATQARGQMNWAAGSAQQAYGDALDEVRSFASDQPVVALLSAMTLE